MRNYILLCSTMLLVPACMEAPVECQNPTPGKAVLVAYRVSKHSHMWFKNPITTQVYDIGSLGGRREPNINLGDTINVQYCGSEIVFNRYNYVKKPVNRETRFIYFTGFDYLYPY